MAFQGNHYIVTFHLGNPNEVTKIDIYAKDDSDARRKLEMIHPTAQQVVVSSAA